MVEKLGNSYSDLLRSHAFWIITSVFILGASAIVGPQVGPELGEGVLLQLFSTLITAVASVLAISFSVLFISTQIASERYSPKFTVSFVNDGIVKSAFSLGILSIFFNILAIVLSPSVYTSLDIQSGTNASLLFWGIGGAITGLNLVFLIWLYPFIRLILIQTTPDNILSQFRRQLSPDQYKREAVDADKISNHPMQPVYDFARNSIRREDYSAAISATEALFDISRNVLTDLSKGADPVSESIFSPVLNNYASSILRQSDSDGFDDAIDSICSGIVKFGAAAVDVDEKRVFQEAFSAAYSLFEERDKYNSHTHQSIISCCSRLFSTAASRPSLLYEYVPRMSNLLTRIKTANEISYFQAPISEIAKAHDESIFSDQVSQTEVYEEKVLLGFQPQKQAWEQTKSDTIPSHLACTYLLMQASSEIIDMTTSDSPPGYLYEGWDSIIANTDPDASTIHLQHLFRRYIELLSYSEENYDIGLSSSMRIKALIKNNGYRRAALAACESIVDETRSCSELRSLWFLESELINLWIPIKMTDYPDTYIQTAGRISDEIQEN